MFNVYPPPLTLHYLVETKLQYIIFILMSFSNHIYYEVLFYYIFYQISIIQSFYNKSVSSLRRLSDFLVMKILELGENIFPHNVYSAAKQRDISIFYVFTLIYIYFTLCSPPKHSKSSQHNTFPVRFIYTFPFFCFSSSNYISSKEELTSSSMAV